MALSLGSPAKKVSAKAKAASCLGDFRFTAGAATLLQPDWYGMSRSAQCAGRLMRRIAKYCEDHGVTPQRRISAQGARRQLEAVAAARN
jgi:hypothetical protein